MLKWLSSILGGIFGLKSFLHLGMTVIIVVVAYNLCVDIIEEVMNFSIIQISGASYSGISSPSISGFAGWVLAQWKVPECVSVIVSFTVTKFILRKIPFIKW
jgi:hypothetical protein